MEAAEQLLARRTWNKGWIEFRSSADSNSIIPYFISNLPESKTLLGRLRPLSSPLSLSKLEETKQFLLTTEFSVEGTEVTLCPSSQIGENIKTNKIEESCLIDINKSYDYIEQGMEPVDNISIYLREAKVCFNSGSYKDSVLLYEKAYKLADLHDTVDKSSEALINMEKACEKLKDNNTALEYFRDAYSIFKKDPESKCYGIACYGLGIFYRELGNCSKAVEYFEQAKPILSKWGAKGEYIEVLRALGVSHYRMQQYPSSTTYCQEGLKLAQSSGLLEQQVSCYILQGAILDDQMKYEQAIKEYLQALPLAEKIDGSYLVTLYDHLGVVYDNMGKFGEGEDYYRKSIQLAKTLAIPERSSTIYNLGELYVKKGRYNEAMTYLERALELSTARGEELEREMAIGEIGNVLVWLGIYEGAIDHYRKTLNLNDPLTDINTLNDPGTACDVLCGLAEAYLGLNNPSKAKQCLEKRIPKAEENPQVLASSYRLLSRAYRNESDYNQSVECLEKSIKSLSTPSNSAHFMEKISCELDLGTVYCQVGENEKAISQFNNVLREIQNIEAREYQAMALMGLGKAYKQLNNFAEAENAFREAAAIFSLLQNELGHDEWRITIFENQAEVYSLLQEILIAQKHFNDALTLLDSGMSRALVSLLGSKSSESSKQSVNELFSVEEIQQLAGIYETTFIFYSYNPNTPSTIHAWVVSEQGKVMFQSLKISDISPLVDELKLLPKSEERLRLGELIAYLNLDTENNSRLSKKPPQRISNKSVNLYDRNKKIYQQLYQALIAPIKSWLPSENLERSLTFVLDTALHKVPFSVLLDENEKYLVEKWAVSMVPSVKVFKQLGLRRKEYARQGHTVVISNPTNDLHYAVDEIGAISQAFPNHTPIKEIKEKNATRAAVRAQATEASHLHFICHGNPDTVDRPYSVFQGALKLADGPWHAFDIGKTAFLQADLVFLSACQTGKGKEQKEGTIGLTRSFLAAGASSVIATHWSISDATTTPVVQSFYEHLLLKHGNKAKALREAMLYAIRSEQNNGLGWRHQPERWGAFFLTGLPN